MIDGSFDMGFDANEWSFACVFFAFLPMTCGSKGKGREIGKRGDVFVRFFYRVREVLWRRTIFLGLFLTLMLGR